MSRQNKILAASLRSGLKAYRSGLTRLDRKVGEEGFVYHISDLKELLSRSVDAGLIKEPQSTVFINTARRTEEYRQQLIASLAGLNRVLAGILESVENK